MSYPEVRSAILLVAGLYLLFQFVGTVTAVLFLFFLIFLLAMALNPIVNWLTRRRVPRGIAVALIGVAVVAVGALLMAIILPPMVQQAQEFVRDAPQYWSAAQERVQSLAQRFPFLRNRLAAGGGLGQQAIGYAATLLGRAGGYTLTAAGALFTLALVFILTLYTLANPRPVVEGVLGAVPAEQRERTRTALIRIAAQMRAWVGASVLLGAIIGILDWLGLVLLGVPNALLLGVLGFFGEFVPNFGPLIAAVPAVLLALAVSPQTALWVILLYVAVQQIESYFLAPLIMGNRLELHPVSIAFFVLVMGALVGVIGAILAVPIAATVKILYEEFYYKPRHPDQAAIDRDADAVIAA